MLTKIIVFIFLVIMVGLGGNEVTQITGESLLGSVASFIGGIFIAISLSRWD